MNEQAKNGLKFYIKGLLWFSLCLFILFLISNILYLKNLNDILINQPYCYKCSFNK